mmetsp:Transcript_25441/g.33222  ORF Transcript_25441/g.33222 Transcript_25441/m.33222 type:complete len:216 (+) Transcript_25441:266-913(+)
MISSTALPTFFTTDQVSNWPGSNSTTTSKIGAPALWDLTLLPWLLSRAVASPKVTEVIPPTSPFSCGFRTRECRFPWALAKIRTSRSLTVLAAPTSCGRPISSMMMMSGVWFCNVSIMTLSCSLIFGTIILLANPTEGCTISPSPAISFDVSTITTCSQVDACDNFRAISRIIVVFPQPGRPKMRTAGLSIWSKRMSSIMSAFPLIDRPTLIVKL